MDLYIKIFIKNQLPVKNNQIHGTIKVRSMKCLTPKKYVCKNLCLKLVNFFNLLLSKFTFSGDIINEMCKKLMTIKAVKDLEDHLFRKNQK